MQNNELKILVYILELTRLFSNQVIEFRKRVDSIGNNFKKVQYLHSSFDNKEKLIEIWNKTRPNNFPVGECR